MARPPRAHIDFETFSAADLKRVGPCKYAEHGSTEVLCLGWAIGDEEPRLWEPRHPPPARLFRHVAEGGIVCAWNAEFERAIWQSACWDRMAWPLIPLRQWRDTAATAASLALPIHLASAGAALKLDVQKDKRGTYLIQKLCKPRRPSKSNLAARWTPETAPEDFRELYAYCRQDVKSERAIERALPILDVSPLELEVWRLTVQMNERGWAVDLPSVERMLGLLARHATGASAEIRRLTGGAVETGGQRDKILEWLRGRGVEVADLKVETVAKKLAEVADPEARRLLELRQEIAKASVKKYAAMRDRACRDGTVKNNVVYHGSTTGRDAGRGMQIQNFPRATVVPKKEPNPEASIERAVRALWTQSPLGAVELAYGSATQFASAMLRSMLVAKPGRILYGADYCVDPCALVLTEDLRWIQARELIIGQEIIAFDEKPAGGNSRAPRRLKTAQILRKSLIRTHKVRVSTTLGSTIVSGAHGFLMRRTKWKTSWQWCEASKLRPGDRVAFAATPWVCQSDYRTGWLAGFLDGEGCVNSQRVAAGQNHGLVLERAKLFLHLLKIDFTTVERKSKNFSTISVGRMWDKLRLLGTVRPCRLLPKANSIWEGKKALGEDAEVLRVEDLGEGLVVALGTSTKTFFSDGFFSHNSSIENRITVWYAEDAKGIEIFERGLDQYRMFASDFYGVRYEDVDPAQRDHAKGVILGCCFGMGADTFLRQAAKFGQETTKEVAQRAIDGYREIYADVVQLWYGLNRAAIEAVRTKRPTRYKRIQFRVEGRFLYMVLASSRRLAYYEPRVDLVRMPWGEKKPAVTCMGTDAYSKEWRRLSISPGRFTENAVQATARDVMMAGALATQRAGYDLVGRVHDELISEADPGFGSVSEYEKLMTEPLPWLVGIPIEAKGWSGRRFRKG